MPSLRTAGMTVAIMLVALFLIVKFAPSGVATSVGLNPKK